MSTAPADVADDGEDEEGSEPELLDHIARTKFVDSQSSSDDELDRLDTSPMHRCFSCYVFGYVFDLRPIANLSIGKLRRKCIRERISQATKRRWRFPPKCFLLKYSFWIINIKVVYKMDFAICLLILGISLCRCSYRRESIRQRQGSVEGIRRCAHV